jgi:hypothetical protein
MGIYLHNLQIIDSPYLMNCYSGRADRHDAAGFYDYAAAIGNARIERLTPTFVRIAMKIFTARASLLAVIMTPNSNFKLRQGVANLAGRRLATSGGRRLIRSLSYHGQWLYLAAFGGAWRLRLCGAKYPT